MFNKLRHLSKKKYISFFVVVIVLFAVWECIISSKSKSAEKEIARVARENAALEQQLHDLQDELAFIRTDEGLELYARAQGMSMPGEVHYTVK